MALSLSTSSGLAARPRMTECAASGLFHHLRHHKETVLRRRRVLDDVVEDAAIGDHVLALLHVHGSDRGHRLDALDVDFRQLLHEGKDGIELPPQVLDLIFGNRDAREMRDAADGGGVDGHGARALLKRTKSSGPSAASLAEQLLRRQPAVNALLRASPEGSI